MDPFIRPLEHYKRRIDILNDYVNDAAKYLSVMTGDNFEECQAFVRKSITRDGKRQLFMPRVAHLHRQANGDRVQKTMSFMDYLNRAFQNNEIMAPTMTTYMPTSKKQSLLAVYIDGNLKRRSKAKKAMFQAEIDGLQGLRNTLNFQQSTFKIKNNALSGAQCSPFTPMWNKTGHSTLTSICRTATSNANANNEKFLYGNRHYYSADIVKTNLITIIRHSNYEKMIKVMERWKIRPPTVEETMECIRRSTNTYWRNPEQMAMIEELVSKLTDLERSAFVYSNDLYHLAMCIPNFVHSLLAQLSEKSVLQMSIEDTTACTKKLDDNLKAFVSVLCAKELMDPKEGRVKGIKELRERAEAGEEEAIQNYGILGSTIFQKLDLIDRYADFIEAFWTTDNLPSSTFAIPSIVRRGVLTSDTDSTIFTVQSWVEWQHGKITFDDEAVATANSLVYIASQIVRHILALISGNMGVDSSEILRLEMKNEFYFPVFALTSRAKHYYAYRGAQEGVVKSKLEPEIKGVALRSSAVSSNIINLAHQTMFEIMDSVMKGERIKLASYVRKVATIEREVLEHVANGSFEYFRRSSIKERKAYKAENGGNFIHYELWQACFAQKYGDAPDPPYQTSVVSMNTDRPKRLEAWLNEMEDQDIANRIRQFCKEKNKLYIGSLQLPVVNLIAHGVPKEISSAVDVRALIAQLMESFYLILEGLGVYARNKSITRLISDDPTIPSFEEGVLNVNPGAATP